MAKLTDPRGKHHQVEQAWLFFIFLLNLYKFEGGAVAKVVNLNANVLLFCYQVPVIFWGS